MLKNRANVFGVALACVLLLASATATAGAGASTGFGIKSAAVSVIEKGGEADTQAGSHPHALIAEAVLDSSVRNAPEDEVKDLDFELPPGLDIDAGIAALCTDAEFANCPGESAIGEVELSVGGTSRSTTVYDLAPPPGELAQFGFSLEGIWVMADVSVRTGDYGMTLSMRNISHILEVESVKLTLGSSNPMLVTLPTSCDGSSSAVVQGDSWGGEGGSLPVSFPPLTGCDRLAFDPFIGIQPDIAQAGELSGYVLEIQDPHGEGPAGLAAADVREATVTLPAGISLTQSGLEVLTGCSEAEFRLDSGQSAICPEASAIGMIELKVPSLGVLPEALEGRVYVASPLAGPAWTPLGLYLEARQWGMTVKLVGQLTADPVTGQLTLSFDDLPQLPLSDIRLAFFGGRYALLSTPLTCGSFTATSKLTSWSGDAPVTPSSTFAVATGKGGGACPGLTSSESPSGSPSPGMEGANGSNATVIAAKGGVLGVKTTSKPKPLTRAQLLAKALKQCKKQSKHKRAKCEALARKRYGPKAKTKGKKK
jgi:hypothetical protein